MLYSVYECNATELLIIKVHSFFFFPKSLSCTDGHCSICPNSLVFSRVLVSVKLSSLCSLSVLTPLFSLSTCEMYLFCFIHYGLLLFHCEQFYHVFSSVWRGLSQFVYPLSAGRHWTVCGFSDSE